MIGISWRNRLIVAYVVRSVDTCKEIKLDGRRAAENRDHHLDLALLQIDVAHDAREILERPVNHLDAVAHLKRHFDRPASPCPDPPGPRMRSTSALRSGCGRFLGPTKLMTCGVLSIRCSVLPGRASFPPTCSPGKKTRVLDFFLPSRISTTSSLGMSTCVSRSSKRQPLHLLEQEGTDLLLLAGEDVDHVPRRFIRIVNAGVRRRSHDGLPCLDNPVRL